ncbi:MAG: hypothetical protein HY042_04345 [Spirochaetia bacterium]|nr:hypothetical protein [Spirochaetia bacterium]
MKKILMAALLAVSFGAGIVVAQIGKHPNLAAALNHLKQAEAKIVDAQKANEYDLGGHAKKAKDLIDQAKGELEKAANAASK